MNYPELVKNPSVKLEFYITHEHACNYLDDRLAKTLVADPQFPVNRLIHSRLSGLGFRRSGSMLYKPHCDNCSACIPVRISVHEFKMKSRKHRRTWKINSDLRVQCRKAGYDEKYYDLYRKYVNEIHKDGGMDNPSPEDFMHFLLCDWADTTFYEILQGEKLVAVAVTDRLEDGLSAVYTFYDPAYRKRSLGIYSILIQINEVTKQGLDWLYLGYWIADCTKMNYKNQFDHIEYYSNNKWLSFVPG